MCNITCKLGVQNCPYLSQKKKKKKKKKKKVLRMMIRVIHFEVTVPYYVQNLWYSLF